jgi:hypothetical protein
MGICRKKGQVSLRTVKPMRKQVSEIYPYFPPLWTRFSWVWYEHIPLWIIITNLLGMLNSLRTNMASFRVLRGNENTPPNVAGFLSFVNRLINTFVSPRWPLSFSLTLRSHGRACCKGTLPFGLGTRFQLEACLFSCQSAMIDSRFEDSYRLSEWGYRKKLS